MNDDEKTYKKLIDDLKNLPKIDAPKNFETNLWRKINQQEPIAKESLWAKLFTPARYIPATVVAAFLVFIIVISNKQNVNIEDTLVLENDLKTEFVIYIPRSTEAKSYQSVNGLLRQETTPEISNEAAAFGASSTEPAIAKEKDEMLPAENLQTDSEIEAYADDAKNFVRSKLDSTKDGSTSNRLNFKGGTAGQIQNNQSQAPESTKQSIILDQKTQPAKSKIDSDQQNQNNRSEELQKPK